MQHFPTLHKRVEPMPYEILPITMKCYSSQWRQNITLQLVMYIIYQQTVCKASDDKLQSADTAVCTSYLIHSITLTLMSLVSQRQYLQIHTAVSPGYFHPQHHCCYYHNHWCGVESANTETSASKLILIN